MRMRPALFLLLGLAVLCTAGCGGGGGGLSAPVLTGASTDTVTVSGRIDVPDSADDSGVLIQLMRKEGAQVAAIARMIRGESDARPEILRQAAPAAGLFMGVTDAAGRFVIPGVPRAIYVLQASKGASFAAQREINLQTAEPTTPVSGTTEIPPIQLTPTGTITGSIVTRPASTDLSGFLCYIEGTSHLSVTNAAGAFRLTGVPYNQSVVVTVSRPGFGLVRSTAVSITTAGEEKSVGTLTLFLNTGEATATGISVTADRSLLSPALGQRSVTLSIALASGTAPSFMFFRLEAENGPTTTTPAVAFGPSQILSFSADGRYRVTAVFIDPDGSRRELRLAQPIVVDRVPPVIREVAVEPMSQPPVIGGEPGALHSRTLVLRVEVADLLSGPARLQLTLAGSPLGPAYEIPAGQNTALVRWSGELPPADNNGTGQTDYPLGLVLTDWAGNEVTGSRVYPYHPLSDLVDDEVMDGLPRQPVNLPRQSVNLAKNYGTRLGAVFMDGAVWWGFPPDSVTVAHGTLDADYNYTPPPTGDDTVSVNLSIDGIVKTIDIPIVFNEFSGLTVQPSSFAIEAGSRRTLDFLRVFRQVTGEPDRELPLSAVTILRGLGSVSGLDYVAPSFATPDTLILEYVENGVPGSVEVSVNVYALTGITAYQDSFEIGAGEGKRLTLQGYAHFSDSAFDRDVLLTPSVSLGTVSGDQFLAPVVFGDANIGNLTLVYNCPSATPATSTAVVNYNVVGNPLIQNFTISPPPPTAGFAFLDFDTDQPCQVMAYYGTRSLSIPVGSDPLDYVHLYGNRAEPIGVLPEQLNQRHRIVLEKLNDGMSYSGRIVAVNRRGQTTVGPEITFVNGYTNIDTPVVVSEAPGWTGLDPSGQPVIYGADASILTVGEPAVLFAFKVQNGSVGNEEIVRFDSVDFRGVTNDFNYRDLTQLRLFAVDSTSSEMFEIPIELSFSDTISEANVFRLRISKQAPQYILPANVQTFVLTGQPNGGAGTTLGFELVRPVFTGLKSGLPKIDQGGAVPVSVSGSVFNVGY